MYVGKKVKMTRFFGRTELGKEEEREEAEWHFSFFLPARFLNEALAGEKAKHVPGTEAASSNKKKQNRCNVLLWQVQLPDLFS